MNPQNIVHYLLMFIQLTFAFSANEEWLRSVWLLLFIITMIVKDAVQEKAE